MSKEKTATSTERDEIAINKLTNLFFDLFTNTNGKSPQLEYIKTIFIAQGIIISNNDAQPQVYDLDGFIKPRREMLTDGTLINFSEYEVSHETKIFRNIAQRFCLYKKSGTLNGKSFMAEGMKTIQFIRTPNEWKISSVAWSDFPV